MNLARAALAMTLLPTTLAQAAPSDANEPLPPFVAERRVLFGEFTWPHVPKGIRGASVEYGFERRTLGMTLPARDSGAQVRVQNGPAPIDLSTWLDDAHVAVEVVFRAIPGSPLPEGLCAELESRRRKTADAEAGGRKVFRSAPQPLDGATPAEKDGWRRLCLPLGVQVATAEPGDLAEMLRLVGESSGSLDVREVSLVRMRRIAVAPTNPPRDNTLRLVLEGVCTPGTQTVALRLSSRGQKPAERRVAPGPDGRFRCVWDNPPVPVRGEARLEATIAGASDAAARTPAAAIFGYLPDERHLWIHAGPDTLMTSPESEGGERPFLVAGVGYGKDVILRGYDDEIAAYCRSMGLNTIRLAFYTTRFNSRAESPLSTADIAAFIDPVIDAARRNGLYVLLDAHEYFKNEIDEATARGEQRSDGWTEARFREWIGRWEWVASRYRDEPHVLGYELCNEPVCSPETARTWYRRCAEAIRRIDERHVIVVGAHHWSHARSMAATWDGADGAIERDIPGIAFSFHDYPLDNNPWEVRDHLRAFRRVHRAPLLCTEFGCGGKPERVHREFQTGMLSLFALDRIGWLIWTIQDAPDRAMPFPTKAVQDPQTKKWSVADQPRSRYWIPYEDLWAASARIMATPYPKPDK